MARAASLLVSIAAALAVASCSTGSSRLWEGVEAVSSATVSAKTVFVAAQSFGGAELAAATYLGLRRCTEATRPICREPGATPIIKGASQSGRIARDELKAQLRVACAAEFAAGTECDKGIPVASYNTLVRATEAISRATAAYRTATGQ